MQQQQQQAVSELAAPRASDETIFSPHYTLLQVSFIVVVSALTLAVALVELLVLIRKTGQFFSYKMSLMYLALVELFVVILHYSFFNDDTWTYVAFFIENVMFIVVAYFFSLYALRVRGLTRFVRPVVIPVALLLLAVSVVFLVIECVNVRLLEPGEQRDCVDFSWALFSSVQLVLAVILVVTGRIITKNPQARTSVGRPQKRRKYFVVTIYVYTASCVMVLLLQFVFGVSFSSMSSCRSFLGGGSGESAFVIILYLCAVALPTWVILVVFYSLSQRGTQFTAHIKAVMDRDNRQEPMPPEARALLDLFGGGSMNSAPRIIRYGTADQPAINDGDAISYEAAQYAYETACAQTIQGRPAAVIPPHLISQNSPGSPSPGEAHGILHTAPPGVSPPQFGSPSRDIHCNSSRLHLGGRVCIVLSICGESGVQVARVASEAVALAAKSAYKPAPNSIRWKEFTGPDDDQHERPEKRPKTRDALSQQPN
eukprot:m51a1_g6204 hypothetical protein (484) ;mRNA; r:134830-138743